MDQKKMNELRHEVLKTLEEEFTKEFVPAKIVENDVSGVEILATIFEEIAVEGLDASGEFFFLPNKDDEELQFFVNLITISEHLPENTLGDLMAAVSVINTYILTGAFAIDPIAGTLIFKHVYEMPIDLDKDKVTDYADLSMGVSILMVQQYAYYLLEVKDGERTVDSVIKALAMVG